LLTNDDGITSPGLAAARAELSRLGSVVVVAPDSERSAVGHAITILSPLRVKRVSMGRGKTGYAVAGMPADCVKLAVGSLLKKPVDIVVSGINLGPNTGTNIIYSGTVSAATEARILGIPAIAVSIGTFDHPRWGPAARLARRVAEAVLEHGLPEKVLLNVNVPNLPLGKMRGIRITRMGQSGYVDQFNPSAASGDGATYSLVSRYQPSDTDEATDGAALEAGWTTITPVTFDLTAHAALADVAAWRLSL
ncbi:MAG TPA: 5'/3'-nucleotidase SurE, partial [Candidatus Dormibacteraeota bacterium]|nr:5'/3'-nucleotidase SurE [Candidatus Dormibacteraeota bacterium]